MFGGEPDVRRTASSGRDAGLQGGADLLRREPARVLQLRAVHVQLREGDHTPGSGSGSLRLKPRTAHLGVGGADGGVAAQHEGAVGERPVLRGAVGHVLNLQTHLLCHLPVQRLLQSLTWKQSAVRPEPSRTQEPGVNGRHRPMSQKPARALYIPRGKDAWRPSRQRLPSDSSTMTTGDICEPQAGGSRWPLPPEHGAFGTNDSFKFNNLIFQSSAPLGYKTDDDVILYE